MTIPAYDWIAYHAAHHGDKLAAIDLATERHLTYDAFDERIGRLAAGLRAACGVSPGDRVCVLAHNSTDVFEIQFACARLGAIIVPMNWRLTVPELRYIVTDAAPRVLLHDPEFADAAQELAQAGAVPSCLSHGGAAADYERLIATHAPLETPFVVTHDDVATILYTSGTTGRPKGAMIRHGMRFWLTTNLTISTGLSADTVFLTTLPLFHAAGLDYCANPVFHAGGTVLVMRQFDPADCLHLLTNEALGVNLFCGVPAQYLFTSQQPEFASVRFRPDLRALVGAAPVALTQLRAWEERGLTLRQVYGMTESGLVTILDTAEASRKAGSAGKPSLHMELRLVTQDGQQAAVGEIGEIWVRGPSVTQGYWRNAEANATAFVDGWLRTGDAATRDAEGFITIVDRWKDMYISGGENVYPAEVENLLYEIPGIAEVAVIGVPDARWGETGCAVVARKPNATLSEADILGYCDGRLARYKQPRSVWFVDALPRTGSGKVHKPTLRAMVADKGRQ